MGRRKYMIAGSIKTLNPYMQDVIAKLGEMASYRRIFIIGDTGTGKDTLAGIIHKKSAESELPFKKVDCRQAKVNDILISSNVVTYFDEIHTLGKGLQERLMTELEKHSEAYIISSADTCVEDMIERKQFYEELYLLLANVHVQLPGLLFRREDIPSMVRGALSKYNRKYGKGVGIDENALSALAHYNFRGNITELYNIIERAVLTNTSGKIKANSILSVLDADSLSLVTMMKDTGLSLRESLDRYERMLLINAINDTESADEASRLLNISRSSFYSKCKKHKITVSGSKNFDK